MRFAVLLLVAALSGAPLAACNTYRDALGRSQRAFEASEYERALALLRDLEGDTARLPPADRAAYAYLRGMTDLRIGHRADARHWLALARAYEEQAPGTLPADWKERTSAAVADLDAVVHGAGYAALVGKAP